MHKKEEASFPHQQDIRSVVMIGAGNVAWHIAQQLTYVQVPVVQVVSRSLSSSKTLAEQVGAQYTNDLQLIYPDADAYVISVTDHAIPEIIQRVNFGNHVVVHTAGSISMDVFRNYACNYGILYPLQTFTKGRRLIFSKIPLLVEASDPVTLEKIRKLASLLSNQVMDVDSHQRQLIHLAAVFASNFTNHMLTVAEDILQNADISFDLLRSLIQETLDKAMQESPRKVQTGPAIRGDVEIMERHLKMLEHNPDLQEIYKMVSRSISRLKE